VTDVTQDVEQDGAELSAADEQVLRELTERARTGGLKLTGESGLLGRLTKMVIEGALEGELDDHLGYGRHDPQGRDGGNSRNGRRAKTHRFRPPKLVGLAPGRRRCYADELMRSLRLPDPLRPNWSVPAAVPDAQHSRAQTGSVDLPDCRKHCSPASAIR
jgi:hypothetical protein